MRYLITIGIIFFFCIVELIAQSNFRDGYIINNNNDTLYGLLDYKGNKANTKKCIYREDINSEIQVFTPEEIMAYRFTNGKFYISKSVNTGNETKQLFLEYLINGIVDIYYYRGDKGEYYFLDNGSGNLDELKNEEKEIVINNSRYIVESKEYIGLLNSTFKDSPSVSKRVENVSLTHKSLIKITHDYHNEVCSDEECIIYEKKLPRIKNSFGIVAGLNVMSTSQISEFLSKHYYLSNSQFGFKVFPSIGLYYKVNMPFINERLYFQYEGTYSHVNLSSNSNIESNQNYVYTITLTQNTFKNLGIIKYEFPKGKIRPTFQLGAFLKYYFKHEYTRNLEVIYSWGDSSFTRHKNVNPYSKFEFGINCGAGFKYIYFRDKELFFDFRYQRGFGLLYGLNANIFLVNLGVQIWK